MSVIWVTGNSGAGKSTVCELLKRHGHDAVDADWEGYNHWVDRTTDRIVVSPPYPAPRGWLHRFGWKIDRARVEALAARAAGKTVFLCGSVENEDEVRDLFDLMICLVVDDETVATRLASRTTNAFGQHPEELAAALDDNVITESTYRRLGATIIDGTQAPEAVVEEVLAAASAVQRERRAADN
ncbi:AAA family ATPase [Cryptosporangium minutisporangium]|uniref:AAA family ATPase n=1 Tax=Cryptosporangium minutisporangium TaxID=113569 RepID=UPI0031E9F8D6